MNTDKKDIYIWDAGAYGGLIAFDLQHKGMKTKGFIDSLGIWRIKRALPLPILTPETFFKLISPPSRT